MYCIVFTEKKSTLPKEKKYENGTKVYSGAVVTTAGFLLSSFIKSFSSEAIKNLTLGTLYYRAAIHSCTAMLMWRMLKVLALQQQCNTRQNNVNGKMCQTACVAEHGLDKAGMLLLRNSLEVSCVQPNIAMRLSKNSSLYTRMSCFMLFTLVLLLHLGLRVSFVPQYPNCSNWPKSSLS